MKGPEPFRIRGICSHRVSGKSELSELFPAKGTRTMQGGWSWSSGRQEVLPARLTKETGLDGPWDGMGLSTPSSSVLFLRDR